ncbi:MAG: lysophospholipid acyltransferase family protein [Candidatus Thiodiazotropha sp. (ex Ctena orbiculata)]|nr:lysophospholipid acyltransferase family protein [Candidatus Thiodiazotropha taylori]
MSKHPLYPIWRVSGYLPLNWLHRIGHLLGRFYIWLPNREKRSTEVNLRLCFPEKSDRELGQLRDRSIRQMGATLMEMAAIWFTPTERVLGMIKQVSGSEQLVREEGQGLVVLLPHLGCWEIIGLELPTHEQVTSLYRPPRNRAYETLVRQARERSGAKLVPTDTSGVKQIYQTLLGGGVTCILPDQQPRSDKGAVFAPFFGVPALTMLLTNRLVRKTGAKVVFAYAERLSAGAGYHIHYLPADERIREADPVMAASALNQGIESIIRELPSQYQWSYKRFQIQPDGKQSPYRRSR